MSDYFDNRPLFTTGEGVAISPVSLNPRAVSFSAISSLVLNKTVLDIGCNNGRWMSWLLDNGASHVTGIDVDTVDLAAAESNLGVYFESSNYSLQESSWENYSPSSPFDLVFCAGMLHFGNTQQTLIHKLPSLGTSAIIEATVCTPDQSTETSGTTAKLSWYTSHHVRTMSEIQNYLETSSYSTLNWIDPGSVSDDYSGRVILTAT